jgi:hypothetical protein
MDITMTSKMVIHVSEALAPVFMVVIVLLCRLLFGGKEL